MEYYDFWEIDAFEAISEFVNEPLTTEAVKKVVYGLGLGAFEESYAPTNATRMVLVHSVTDYAFTTTDIEWLSSAQIVILGNICESDLQLFTFELDCPIDEYYIHCAALIKLFNKAFPGDNVYLFRINSVIAFGSMRTFDEENNNFCITKPFNKSDAKAALSLVDELSSASKESIPQIISAYSPQEIEFEVKDYDKRNSSVEDTRIWNELKLFYDVGERSSKNLSELDNLDNKKYTYRKTCWLLADVACNADDTSYDILDSALTAEERAKAQQNETSFEIEQLPDTSEKELYQEAFRSAEDMLKEL